MNAVESQKQKQQPLSIGADGQVTKDKKAVVYLLMKYNPDLKNREIKPIIELMDGRGIANNEIADVREMLGRGRREEPETVTEPTQSVVPTPVKVTAPVQAADTTIRFYDRVKAVSGPYFGVKGKVVKFGKSQQDGAVGAKVRLDDGTEIWTDLKDLAKDV